MTLDNWVTDAINIGVSLGGKKVSEDHYLARVAICKGCDFWGSVDLPIPGKSGTVPGCIKCRCPTATKPRWEKYFSAEKLSIVKAECPDGLWAKIDKVFLTKI